MKFCFDQCGSKSFPVEGLPRKSVFLGRLVLFDAINKKLTRNQESAWALLVGWKRLFPCWFVEIDILVVGSWEETFS